MTIFFNNFHKILNSAIESVTPSKLFANSLSVSDDILIIGSHSFHLDSYKNIYVVGAGKASAYMAKEIEKLLVDRITIGCISTNSDGFENCEHIKIIEGSHPVPDTKSLLAGKEIIDLAIKAGEDDLVICLISGGGSSVMEYLPDSISLGEYQNLTDALIKCGADINEINCVRSSLSLIKGGKLAEAIYPATCLSLIISDVIGDNLETIASGPTYIGLKNKLNPVDILSKYNLLPEISKSIIDFLTRNYERQRSDLVNISEKTFNIILGNNSTALNAAKSMAEELGYRTSIINKFLSGEASNAGTQLAKTLKSSIGKSQKQCLLFGGETTVTVHGEGRGGRNQELVLSALIELENNTSKFILASVGTDGKDGPTDAAGAVITETTWSNLIELNLNPRSYLANNDSYNLFKQTGSLIKTGPTKTNVMDIQFILIH